MAYAEKAKFVLTLATAAAADAYNMHALLITTISHSFPPTLPSQNNETKTDGDNNANVSAAGGPCSEYIVSLAFIR